MLHRPKSIRITQKIKVGSVRFQKTFYLSVLQFRKAPFMHIRITSVACNHLTNYCHHQRDIKLTNIKFIRPISAFISLVEHFHIPFPIAQLQNNLNR